MSNKEVIVKYIVDWYINYKKRKGDESLMPLRSKFENFLLYICDEYEEFENFLEEYHRDDLEYLHEQFDEDEDGQSLMELEQEEYYSNVIRPQNL